MLFRLDAHKMIAAPPIEPIPDAWLLFRSQILSLRLANDESLRFSVTRVVRDDEVVVEWTNLTPRSARDRSRTAD
jgi:hypothetical protein